MKFDLLVHKINQANDTFHKRAVRAVNVNLTVRNWLIGYYIIEYEQKGEDRAEYGTRLLKNLETSLKPSKIKGLNERAFRYYRSFYNCYPEIRGVLTPELVGFQKRGLLSPVFKNVDTSDINIIESLKALSYSHFEQLSKIEDKKKRLFYEQEAIKGTWSVNQLKRQVNTLYYERSSMSKSPIEIPEKIESNNQTKSLIKDVFVMEFLGLPVKHAVSESELEHALLDNIESFLLELGHGFCFEARQKRILIGGEHFFIDLVFYNRILKCHVLVELKVDEFKHHNAGQLNMYLNYFKDKEMQLDDNPPVGILLVTNKNKAMVEYATAGMDEMMFVKKYLLELPKEDEIKAIIEKEIS